VTAHASGGSPLGDGVFQARSGYGLINIQSRLAWKPGNIVPGVHRRRHVLALEGVKVLDLSGVLAGPWCTQTLAGSRRRCLEDRAAGGRRRYRTWMPPELNGESTYFMCCNRSRRSVTMNRKHPERKSWCASWPSKRTPPRSRRTPRAEAEGNASTARAGHRTGKACHRRWNAYGKPQRKGGKFIAVHLGTVRPSYTCILIAVR
jgi:hypothetical protein